MLRTSASRQLRTVHLKSFTAFRFISSEGSTGSGYSRPGGEAQGDSFTKREKAAEDLYVRQQEKQKLMELKEKLKQQRKHLDELDSHIDELTRQQGGEKN